MSLSDTKSPDFNKSLNPENIVQSESDSFKASTASTAFTASTPFTSPTSSPSYRLLIITYYWPPSGGAGVQRWLKFSKYLPESGWTPYILTVDPAFAAYPVTDSSLNEDLPDSVKVYRTRATNYFSIYSKDKSKIPTAGFANNIDSSFRGKLLRFIRGNFFLPDPRRGWNSYALKKACELIESEGITHIITTSPPHSTQLIGLDLKKKYPKIRWIADLRDPWTDIYYYKQFYPTFISKAIDRAYEKRVLEKADRIITVGKSLKELFSSKIRGLDSKIELISNGYDDDDFKDIGSSVPAKLTLTYVGTLSDIYPVANLVMALKEFHAQGSEFILRFVGTVSDRSRAEITADLPESLLEFHPYVTHTEAVKYMLNSSLLILIIPQHHSNKSIITGKIFEYLASGKPIICIGPTDGDAAEIITACNSGITVDYGNSAALSEFLKNPGIYSGNPDERAILSYSRRKLTGRIVKLLNED